MMSGQVDFSLAEAWLSATGVIRIRNEQGRARLSTGYTMAAMRWVKYLWALPTTCVGLLFVPLARNRHWVNGVLEMHGGTVTWFLRHGTILEGGAAAMTLGHVVLGVDQMALDRTREHERVHVRQCERWGLFFLPAYLLCSLYLWVRRRDAYLDNPFEMEARELSD